MYFLNLGSACQGCCRQRTKSALRAFIFYMWEAMLNPNRFIQTTLIEGIWGSKETRELESGLFSVWGKGGQYDQDVYRVNSGPAAPGGKDKGREP